MKKVCISYETGNGRLGGHHTQFAFSGLPGVEIAALADSNPEAEKTYRLTGAKRLYRDTFEMLEKERPDIAVFCSRLPGDHYIQIKYAASIGCSALVEKPFAMDLIQADELLALIKKTGVKVQIAHPARFATVFQEMKKRIEAGELGRVLSCYMRGKEDHRGGGEDMIVLGTHFLDVGVFLFGKPESVYSEIRCHNAPITASDVQPTAEPIGPCAGDDVYSLYRFANGVNGIFESRRGMTTGGPERLGITVSGTKGAFSIRYDGERTLRFSKNFPIPMEDQAEFEVVAVNCPPEIPGSVPFDYKTCGLDPALGYHRYFADNNRRAAWNLLQAVEGKEELISSAESSVSSLEMIIGAYRSALERRMIALPLENREHPLAAKK